MKKILATIFAGAFIMAHNHAMAFSISSNSIQNNSFMSSSQASDRCGGENISPDLEWSGVPDGAKSLALIVHDPDAPRPNGFYHWLVVDIPADIAGLAKGEKFAAPARELNTDSGVPGYMGPCPPQGHGVHHYHFNLYALNVDKIKLTPDMTPTEIEAAVQSQSLGQATITGLYERK